MIPLSRSSPKLLQSSSSDVCCRLLLSFFLLSSSSFFAGHFLASEPPVLDGARHPDLLVRLHAPRGHTAQRHRVLRVWNEHLGNGKSLGLWKTWIIYNTVTLFSLSLFSTALSSRWSLAFLWTSSAWLSTSCVSTHTESQFTTWTSFQLGQKMQISEQTIRSGEKYKSGHTEGIWKRDEQNLFTTISVEFFVKLVDHVQFAEC